MARRPMQLFAVALAVVVLVAQASHSRAQTGNPEDTFRIFLEVERRLGALLEQAGDERAYGDCRVVADLLVQADGLLQIYTPAQIGASGHARLSARVAAAKRSPCPPPGGRKQRPGVQPGALQPQDAATARQVSAEVIEGAFADAEAALLAGDCRRRDRQLAYLERTVGTQGQYGRPQSKTFPEVVKREWQQRLQELRARPCPLPKPAEAAKPPAETSALGQFGEAFADITDIEAELDAILAAAEDDRRRGNCSGFRFFIDEANDLLRSIEVRRLGLELLDSLGDRISAVEDRPCPPPKVAPPSPTAPPPVPPPTRSLGDLRVALAKACGAQFEPARAALLAGIDRAILTAAGDPQRLAALVTDRAYIAGLPVTPCPPPAISPLMTGTFITNFGTMVLVDGRGTYTEKNGRVAPTRVDGLRLEATWEQSASARRCGDGRYRGKLTFSFGQSGFGGFWGYCDEVPNNAWSGQRR